jgi:tRNA G37 N-methylase Trm5
MLIEKTYQNDEDFQNELRKKAPDEIFYNYALKTEQAQVKAEGGQVINGANVYAIITFNSAVLDKEEKNIILIARHEELPPIFVKSQPELDAYEKEIEKAIIDQINEIKKVCDKSFFKKGTLRVGV